MITLHKDAMVVPFLRSNETNGRIEVRQTAAFVAVPSKAQMLQMGQSAEPGPPRRRSNAELRNREHLTRAEVETVIKAARGNRHGKRDAAAIWICFNHALRVGELVDLRWSDIQWDARVIHHRRLKGSVSGFFPLTESDKRFLGPLRTKGRPSDTVFGITAIGFRKNLSRLVLPPELAALELHPHMLRHSCGYDLVLRGFDLQMRAAYMGHARLENTVRYSHLDAGQFEGMGN